MLEILNKLEKGIREVGDNWDGKVNCKLVTFENLFESIDSYREVLRPDEIHLTNQGYACLSDSLIKKIDEWVSILLEESGIAWKSPKVDLENICVGRYGFIEDRMLIGMAKNFIVLKFLSIHIHM